MLKEELIKRTDNAIGELVRDRPNIRKAYNYYNGIRDADLFKYLEENFGLGTPTSIEFTPLIKKHVDALVGEYLGVPILPKVSCKDPKTISNIFRDKLLKLELEVLLLLTDKLLNSIMNILNGKPEDPLIEKELDDLKDNIDNSFISEYEIAAQNLINWVMQSRETDMDNAKRLLALDVLITGYNAYKTEPSLSGEGIKLRVLDINNVFPDRNPESIYLKDSYRIVVRTYKSKSLILHDYDKDLTREDKEKIKLHWDDIFTDDSDTFYVNADSTGIVANREIGILPQQSYMSYQRLIPVYEVEWLETDNDGVTNRYETIRIGGDIYILKGKNENVTRSLSNPKYCSLSVNGVFFLNRGHEPYSLVLACSHLQDKYDILNFYRDNLIASSGTVGLWVDETLIPEDLGDDKKERLLKWLGLKKLGIGILNSAQEGRMQAGASPLNTIFNGFDDTVKVQSVLAILVAIDSVELTVSSITGVFRERLNGILLRDAVTNVLIGLNNSFIITKLYYHLMDLLMNEILLDCVNLCKEVFKDGVQGTLILGDKLLKIFTALPKYYTVTDFDIRISSTSDAIKDLEALKLTIPELIKSGLIEPDILLEAMTTKSITDLKLKVNKSLLKRKAENNLLLLLSLLNLLLLLQLKESQAELEKLSNKVELLNEEKLKIESEKNKAESEVKWFEALTDRTYKQLMIEETKRRTELEIMLLHDGNPYNDKIRYV